MKMYCKGACVDVHPAKVSEMTEKGWTTEPAKTKKADKPKGDK